MIMGVNIEDILNSLIELYREKYPHNPVGVLKYHLNKIGLSPAASIIVLAVENGIKIPEVDELIGKGYTAAEAAEKIASEVEFDEKIIGKRFEYVYVPGAYQRIMIAECTKVPVGSLVSLYGRVVAAYVGESLDVSLLSELSGSERALFTLRDPSGMILVEVDAPIDVTLMRGSIVKVEGRIKRASSGDVYIAADSIVRLQPIEDDFVRLSEVGLIGLNKLPSSMDGRLIKPFKGKPCDTITVHRERRFELLICGCFLCAITCAGIPLLSLFTCCAGIILIILGLVLEHPKIKGFELAKFNFKLLLEHHPPWLRDRCIRLRLLGRELYLCARCTGTFLGYFAAFISGISFPSILFSALLGLPALVDWSTQKLCIRESCNLIRILTGFLLGVGISTSIHFSLLIRIVVVVSFLTFMAIVYLCSIKFLK